MSQSSPVPEVAIASESRCPSDRHVGSRLARRRAEVDMWVVSWIAGSAVAEPAPPPDSGATSFVPGPERRATTALQWVRFFARVRGINVVIADPDALDRVELELILGGPGPTSASDAWELFVSGLYAAGYQLVFVGTTARVVPNAEVVNHPISVRRSP